MILAIVQPVATEEMLLALLIALAIGAVALVTLAATLSGDVDG